MLFQKDSLVKKGVIVISSVVDVLKEAETLIEKIREKMDQLEKLAGLMERKEPVIDEKLRQINERQDTLDKMLSRIESELLAPVTEQHPQDVFVAAEIAEVNPFNPHKGIVYIITNKNEDGRKLDSILVSCRILDKDGNAITKSKVVIEGISLETNKTIRKPFSINENDDHNLFENAESIEVELLKVKWE